MLSHENISQRIFEYHEGILDASQESELMEYLHQYPELNHDFAVWAQARLHDEPVEKPVFYKKLLKEKPFYFNWPAFTRLSFEIATLCSLIFLLNAKPNYHNENRNFESKSIGKKASSVITSTQVFEKQKGNNLTPKRPLQKRKTDVELPAVALHEKDEVKDSLPEVNELTAISGVPTEIDEPEILLYEPTAKEPLVTIPKVEKVKPVVKKVNRKKYYPKQKFSLRPTSKIVPQNKDF